MAAAWAWYGAERVPLEMPGAVEARVVLPHLPPAADDPLGVVADALDAPTGSRPLVELASEARRVVIVVPHAARASAAAEVLFPVLARLARGGHGPDSLSVLVARGLRPAAPKDVVRRLLGPDVMDALSVVQSAPNTPELNASLGRDEELGDVRVHRLVAQADLVLLTGAVVPDPLTGFGGGPQGLVPGVAERETVIRANGLSLRKVLRPDGSLRSCAGSLAPNPLYDALIRATRMQGHCFLLSVILGAGGGIATAAAGDARAAHAEAVGLWQRLRPALPTPQREADLVIAGVPEPRDRDLVQAHEALRAAAAWARPGAPLVWLARAPDGPGPPELLPWFQHRGGQRHLAALRQSFHPAGLVAYAIRRIAKDHPVHVASQVSRDLLRPMGLLPARDPAEALRHALGPHEVRSAVVLPTGSAW